MMISITTILPDVWRMFAVAFSITTLLIALLDRENLLRSDDPYLAGFMEGGFVAVVAMIHSVFTQLPTWSRYKDVIFGSVLAVWCAAWTVHEVIHDGEGDGISGMIAGVSLALGLLAWLLCKVPIPRWATILASVVTVVLVGLYIYVTIAVIGRSSGYTNITASIRDMLIGWICKPVFA